MEPFGERIRRLRTEKDISQRQFAKLLGISPGLISFIERDRNKPNYQIVGRMARILKVSSDYLIFGDDVESMSPNQLLDRLSKELYTEAGEGLKLTPRQKELIEKYDILERLAKLPRVDFEIILEVLNRLEMATD